MEVESKRGTCGVPRGPEESLSLGEEGWEDVIHLEVSITLYIVSYLSTKSFMVKICIPTF